MKSQTLFFTAPQQIEIREADLPALNNDEVLVESICSAVSAGTEMLIYQNRFPRDLETDSVISPLRGEFKYPVAYGYACVGRVAEVGQEVDSEWLNRLVFSFEPHTSHFICKPESVFCIPQSLSPETACFLPNAETAINLVQDAAPILGERVLVLGQGVIGLLTASLLNEFPLDALVTADRYELRRHASRGAGAMVSLDPDTMNFHEEATLRLRSSTNTGTAAQRGFDLTFELSGRPETLNDAIALTAYSGRIVIGSWYGEKRAPIDLGGSFHRSRIKLISSQVSTIAPELAGRWDKARRFEVAWKALERIKPEKWMTHRFSIEEAGKAYDLLDKNPQETIQILFDYKS